MKGRDVIERDAQKECPAFTDEGRESHLISLAMDAAEKQLREGTASSQIIVHYLKMATERHRLECEKIRYENELNKAKREAIEADKQRDDMYREAVAAMTVYQGRDSEDDVNDEEEFYALDDHSDV